MNAAVLPLHPHTCIDSLHEQFLSVMPRIETHARCYFRHLRRRNPEKFADSVAETIALSWDWFVRLIKRGKDPFGFISAIATYAAKWVRAGRRLCGIEAPKDVMSPVCQQRHSFSVGTIPHRSTLNVNPISEALTDNTITPVPDQVMFRMDFPAWLKGLGWRHRRIVQDMMHGEGTHKLARRYGVSPARISQLRREYKQEWDFFGEGLAEKELEMAA